MKIYTALIVALLMIGSPICAQVLDQENDTTGSGFGPPIGPIFNTIEDVAQTFTVGQDGVPYKVSLRVRDITNTGPLLFDIRQVTAGVPVAANSPVLYSSSINASQIPSTYTWIDIDLDVVFSTAMQVSVGDTFAITLRSPTASYQWEQSSTAATYGGGNSFTRISSGMFANVWRLSTIDLGFRTYVQPDSVITDDSAETLNFEMGDGAWVGSGAWSIEPFFGAPNFGGKFAIHTNSNTANLVSTLTSPLIDFTGVSARPIFSFYLKTDLNPSNPDEIRVQIDRNDGLGFVDLNGGVFGQSSNWIPHTLVLDGVIGLSDIRLRFRTVTSPKVFVPPFITAGTVSLDEFKIEVPRIVVTPTSPYFEDFESGSEWLATDLQWELGTPQQSQIFGAFSGTKSWMTGLTTDFDSGFDGVLRNDVLFDFQGFTKAPEIQFAINTSLGTTGTFHINYDRLDGSGPQVLTESIHTGSTNGWMKRTIGLSGLEGASKAILQFVTTGTAPESFNGVAIDDICIFEPTYRGTESNDGDDISMDIFVDGQRQNHLTDSYVLNAGQTTRIETSSPFGTLTGGDYYLFCEAFFGAPTFAQAAPDVWFSFTNTTIILDGGAELPLLLQAPLSPFGQVHDYTYPGGVAGINCLIQAVVVKPTVVNNGFYASSDAFLLQFN